MNFYRIRVKVWVDFSTCRFINGQKTDPMGFVGVGLGFVVPKPTNAGGLKLYIIAE